MSTTNYLVTGANRGLGLAFVKEYASRPSSVVVAAVRDPTKASSKAILDLPTGAGSKIFLVKIDSEIDSDPATAIQEIAAKGIDELTVVVANAAIANSFPLVHGAEPESLMFCYHVNVVAPVMLFQATRTLLQAAAKKGNPAKFVTMGSTAGSIGGMEQVPVPNAAYGTTKAALNFITRKIHFENDDIIAFPIHPGWVQTDGGNHGAKVFGVPSGLADISIEESMPGVLKEIDEASKDKTSGVFRKFDGTVLPW